MDLLQTISAFFLIFFLSSTSAFCYAGDFAVRASKNWQKISQSGENAIYKDSRSNSNETIILQSFRAQGKDTDLFRTMTPQKLTEARTRMMASFGLGNYTVLDISRPAVKNSSIKGVVFIESLFRDLQNRDVQMVERQYLANGKMYVVTYLIDAPAIENRTRIDKILNDFRPKFSSFVSANSEASPLDASMIKDELLHLLNRGSKCILPNAFGDDIADSLTSTVNNSNTNSAVAASIIGDRPLTASEINQQCNNVPVNKRRTAQDTSFSALAKTALTSPKSCIMGIADNAWGIVKGAYDMAAVGVKYTFDSSYRSEVNSTVGVVVAEIKKDPKSFAQRIAAEVYNSAKQMVGDYFACLKPSEQIRSFCNLASNLIPAGILAKIVTKAPLTAIEVAKVAKLAKEAVGVEKTAIKVADEVSTMHEALLRRKQEMLQANVSTASKSASDVGSADKTSTLVSNDDRISRAQQAVGRDLSPAEQQAVSDAHEVGSGQSAYDRGGAKPKNPSSSAPVIQPEAIHISDSGAKNASQNYFEVAANQKMLGSAETRYKPFEQKLSIDALVKDVNERDQIQKKLVESVIEKYPNAKELDIGITGADSRLLRSILNSGVSCGDAVKSLSLYHAVAALGFALVSQNCSQSVGELVFSRSGFSGINLETLARGDEDVKRFLKRDMSATEHLVNNPKLRIYTDAPPNPPPIPKEVIESTFSQSEADALGRYSKDSFSKNDSMREGRPCQDCLVLAQGLKKLPAYDGITYRGTKLSPKDLAQYLTEGGVYQDPAFLSSSVNFGTALHHATKELSSHNDWPKAIFVIKGKTGRAIQNGTASMYTSENEVLFGPNSKFKIDVVQRRSDGIYMIFMEDIS